MALAGGLRKLPCEQSRHEDQQIANAPRAGQRETGGRIKTKRAADQHKAALLNAQSTGHKKGCAADRLNQRFDHHGFDKAHVHAEKIQRDPDLQGGRNALHWLPEKR